MPYTEDGRWYADTNMTQAKAEAKAAGRTLDTDSDAADAGIYATNKITSTRQDIDPLRYEVDKSAWDYEEGTIDPYFQDQMARTRGMQYDDTYDNQARAAEQERRKQYQAYLQNLSQYASGSRSDIRAQLPFQQQQLNQQMNSRLASNRGEYNPVAVMAAQEARSGGLRSLGAQSRIAQAQELQAAQQAYLQAAQAGQQQDLSSMGAESQRAQAMNAYLQNRAAQEQEWYKLGLMDTVARAESKQEREKLIRDTADYDISFASQSMQKELGED